MTQGWLRGNPSKGCIEVIWFIWSKVIYEEWFWPLAKVVRGAKGGIWGPLRSIFPVSLDHAGNFELELCSEIRIAILVKCVILSLLRQLWGRGGNNNTIQHCHKNGLDMTNSWSDHKMFKCKYTGSTMCLVDCSDCTFFRNLDSSVFYLNWLT